MRTIQINGDDDGISFCDTFEGDDLGHAHSHGPDDGIMVFDLYDKVKISEAATDNINVMVTESKRHVWVLAKLPKGNVWSVIHIFSL